MTWFKIGFLAFLPVGVAAGFYIGRIELGLIGVYGLLSVGRIGFQVITSYKVGKRSYRVGARPMASIIMPVFNEEPAIFRASLSSMMRQNYPRYEVIVVDDGSDNAGINRAIARGLGAKYIYQDNAGKREAMFRGFGLMSPETKVVLTTDSDTIWRPNSAAELVKVLVSEPNCGAVTGYVGVSNAKTNLLTKLIDLRYWMAFNQERASQSYFGAVVCVSGPLGAYRRDIIEQIKDGFVTQQFMGKTCTVGDDRHLSNLVLGLGYKIHYAPKAVCLSEAPTTLFQYIKQQARWGKSHWREMIWQFKALPKQSLYLSYDWALTLLLPFLLVASLLYYLFLAVTSTPLYLAALAGVIVTMSFIRIIEPIRLTGNPLFLLFVLYSAFHILVLLPLKFYSLLAVNAGGWGTRKKAEKAGLVA